MIINALILAVSIIIKKFLKMNQSVCSNSSATVTMQATKQWQRSGFESNYLSVPSKISEEKKERKIIPSNFELIILRRDFLALKIQYLNQISIELINSIKYDRLLPKLIYHSFNQVPSKGLLWSHLEKSLTRLRKNGDMTNMTE